METPKAELPLSQLKLVPAALRTSSVSLTSQGKTMLPFLLMFLMAWLGSIADLFSARNQRPPPEVALRVTTLPEPNATNPDQVANLAIHQEFQRRHPEIKLVRAQGIRLETAVAETSIIMMIAGGIAPDVIPLNFRSSDSFIQRGFILPLDELLAGESPESRKAIEARIPAQVRSVLERTGPSGQRHLYGLPGNFLVRGLYFNRELFRAAGLPQRAPRDWRELVEFCRRLKALGPQVRPLFLLAGQNASWDLISFIWSAGGEAVREIAPNEWRAAFEGPAAVTAYEFYYQLAEIDRLAVRSSSKPVAQELNRTGMFFGYVGEAIPQNPELFGFGAVPAGPDGLRGAEINARMYGISSSVSDPGVRAAAWEYIKFLTSEEAQRIQTETLIRLGQAAQVNPVSLRRFGYEQYLTMVPPGLEEELHEAMKTGKPEPYGKNCNLVYSEMTYPLDQILLSPVIHSLWQKGDREGARLEISRILAAAVTRTNERMIGYVSPERMAMRRTVAAIVVALIGTTFIGLGWYVGRQFLQSSRQGSQPVRSRQALAWLCLLPALALILLWKYLPLARGTLMAFQDYEIVLQTTFVGLDNFANALFDPSFWHSLGATLHYAAWTLTLGFAAPILLAYALHTIPRHKVFFRLLYYLPAVISATAVYFLWRELFAAESVLNQLLRFVGFEARRSWTEDPNLAMLSCFLPGLWAHVGPGCLIYLAALKTIPEEQFEAAEIDGAGFLSKTLRIVAPALMPLIAINFVGAVAASFHGATNILIMTGGGPNGATEVTSLLIFYEAFTRLRFGVATAMAWILGSMLIGLTVLQLKRISRMEFKTAK